MENENVNEEATSVGETAEVNLGAIAMVCRIISAASERGAIKADEMSTVGQVFDYMRSFLPKSAQENIEGEPTEDSEEGEIECELEPEAVAAE